MRIFYTAITCMHVTFTNKSADLEYYIVCDLLTDAPYPYIFPRKVCTYGFNNSFYIVEYSALEGSQLIRVPRQPEHLSASGVYVYHLF